MPKRTSEDHELFRMALIAYEAQRVKIDAAIANLRARLGKQTFGTDGQPRKRTMSLAGRRRVAAAQRKRWAAIKRAKAATPKRRKLSVAARHKMAVAARNQWAAQRKAAAKKAKTAVKGTKKPAAAAAS